MLTVWKIMPPQSSFMVSNFSSWEKTSPSTHTIQIVPIISSAIPTIHHNFFIISPFQIIEEKLLPSKMTVSWMIITYPEP